VTTVILALCGAEIASITAAESKEPARAVAQAGSTVSVRILVFYVLSIFCIVSVVPWKNIRSGHSPFAATLEQMGIPDAATIMNLIVLTAVLSCLNSGLYVASRVLFSLAGRGEAPAGMTALNARHVPVKAVWFSSIVAFGVLLTSIVFPKGVFAFLVNASGAIMLFIYLLLAFAHIRVRRRLEKTNPGALQLKMWFFPWATYLSITAMFAALIAMAFKPGSASELWLSLGALAFALLCHVVLTRRRGRVPGAAVSRAGESA
jgi:L-asparagine transporter-like permease